MKDQEEFQRGLQQVKGSNAVSEAQLIAASQLTDEEVADIRERLCRCLVPANDSRSWAGWKARINKPLSIIIFQV